MSGRPKVHLMVPVLPVIERELDASFELVNDPAGADGIVAVPGINVGAALLDRAGPGLRIVANYGVGVDNVDLEAAAARGVTVTNTPDVLTRATAEFALALLLALVRRVAEGDRLVRRGDPWRWEPMFLLGRGLAGRTLLVVGAGRIGTEVARLARGLGMDVRTAGRGDDLAPLLPVADAVSLHVPLTDSTRHLVGAPELRALKRGAVLVNTSRGSVVDEGALVAALEAGELAGAALDVFEDEPEVHPGLLGREDVVLTPHMASATIEAREAMGRLVVDALRAVLVEGREPRHGRSPQPGRDEANPCSDVRRRRAACLPGRRAPVATSPLFGEGGPRGEPAVPPVKRAKRSDRSVSRRARRCAGSAAPRGRAPRRAPARPRRGSRSRSARRRGARGRPRSAA